MTMFTKPERLTDAELDRLGDFLKSCKGGRAMNIEALDGFFAALIAGPETVMPSEYNREVFGGEMSDACEFSSLEEANEIFGLMMRHWNDIAGRLLKDESMFRSCWRTSTAWRTATTGHAASCAGCKCATMAGLSWLMTK
jgi:yecA family protein